jgi:hypothetical protein
MVSVVWLIVIFLFGKAKLNGNILNVMLSVITPNIFMLSVTILSVVVPSIVMRNFVTLSVHMLSVHMLCSNAVFICTV